MVDRFILCDIDQSPTLYEGAHSLATAEHKAMTLHARFYAP